MLIPALLSYKCPILTALQWDLFNDADSAFDEVSSAPQLVIGAERLQQESVASSTTSTTSSILEFKEENGRLYHAYKEGSL